MLRPVPGLLAAVLISIVSPAVADSPIPANACTVEAGKRVITVPYPEGYVRCDGVNKAFDATVASFIPSTHRMLAYFTPPEDAKRLQDGTDGPHLRSFSLQIIKSLEHRDVEAQSFAGIRSRMKAELDKVPALAKAEMERILAEGAANVKKQFGADLPPGLDVSGSSFLGYFEDNSSALGYSMTHRLRENDGEKIVATRRSLAATLMSLVNGRLFVFVASFPFESQADRATAESKLIAWRNAVVAANIGIVPARTPEISTALAGVENEKEKGSGNTVWILTGAGAVIALTVIILRKKRAAARVI